MVRSPSWEANRFSAIQETIIIIIIIYIIITTIIIIIIINVHSLKLYTNTILKFLTVFLRLNILVCISI